LIEVDGFLDMGEKKGGIGLALRSLAVYVLGSVTAHHGIPLFRVSYSESFVDYLPCTKLVSAQDISL
jgi:hypothetical protein